MVASEPPAVVTSPVRAGKFVARILPERKFVPTEVVAITFPDASVASKALVVALKRKSLLKISILAKVLLSVRRVDEAEPPATDDVAAHTGALSLHISTWPAVPVP